MRNDLPSGTVTFLFTDVAGSTRLLEEVGAERYAQALSEHRAALRRAFVGHGGIEVDTQGDAFFFAFGRASDALAAAAGGQAALDASPIRVRMGLHTGAPVLTDEGYVGMDVHRAARIAAAGHGGQVLVSEQTVGLLEPTSSLPLGDLGLHRLKDLGEPVKLFQLGDDGFPPLKSLNATNLPAQPGPLIGRERELEELRELVRSGARLVTVTGPGGTGKTRLALHAAAELIEDFRDGVFWVPLQAVAAPELVVPTIASTLGAQGELSAQIAEKRTLLVLDNLEQLLPDAAGALAELLAACPRLTLLVTSRAVLRVSGEREYPLEPLPLGDAVELFRERAVDGEPEEVVLEICRRLDGLPLAVELAAARTRVLPPPKLLERLVTALPVLTGGARDAPERQRTLRATIVWSHDLLDGEEKRLFARIAVFAGSFDVEAAEEVCRAELDMLASLVERSLVRRWASGRLGMLETIREFAAERLAADPTDQREVSERHATYFRDVALQAGPRLAGPSLGEWLERLATDHANLRLAIEWLTTAGRAGDAVAAAVALGPYLEARGVYGEGRRWLSDALAQSPELSRSLRARATFVLGRLADSAADFAEARRLYEAAMLSFRELRDEPGLVDSMIELCWAMSQQGEQEEARRVGEEALARARSLGDPAVVATALVNLAGPLVELGRNEDALRCYEESLVLRRPLGEERAIGVALGGIAWTAFVSGDLERAKEASEESLEWLRSGGDRQWAPAVLHTLGAIELAERDLDRASALFLEGLAEAAEIGDRRGAPECLLGLAATAASGDEETAARLAGAAERLYDETGVPPSPFAAGVRQQQLAAASARLGDERWAKEFEAGRRLSMDEAVALARAHRDRTN